MLFSRRREAAAEGPAAREARTQPIGEREAQPTGEAERPRRRLGARRRASAAGAAAVGTVSAMILAIARLVMVIAGLIALLVGLAIVLRDVDANASNTIVKGIHEGANFFAGAFTGLITFKGHPKQAITVNWGIALLAYLFAGGLLSRMIAGIAPGRYRAVDAGRPTTTAY